MSAEAPGRILDVKVISPGRQEIPGASVEQQTEVLKSGKGENGRTLRLGEYRSSIEPTGNVDFVGISAQQTDGVNQAGELKVQPLGDLLGRGLPTEQRIEGRGRDTEPASCQGSCSACQSDCCSWDVPHC